MRSALTRWIWADDAVRGFPDILRGIRSLRAALIVVSGLAASDCACRRGMPAGEKLVVYPVDRTAVNVGTRWWSPRPLRAGKAQRRLMPPGGGGASVVVRAWESLVHGEGRQRACSARLEGEEVRR
jgi:hypothetical protein